jgi:hypothetical protein
MKNLNKNKKMIKYHLNNIKWLKKKKKKKEKNLKKFLLKN